MHEIVKRFNKSKVNFPYKMERNEKGVSLVEVGKYFRVFGNK